MSEDLLDENTLKDFELVKDNLVSIADQTDEEVVNMTSAKWSDFVMTKFSEKELDYGGYPKVNGLRRVVRELLGPIIKSKAKVVQAPHMPNNFERSTLLQPAVMEYEIAVLVLNTHNVDPCLQDAFTIEYTDAADCYYGNINDPMFAKFLTAYASTRAEARTLRKILQLDKAASEELSFVPTEESSVDGMIVPTQVNFINILCHRNNINIVKFINMGKNKYRQIEDIPYDTALKMVECLSNYQNSPDTIPESIKGYDKEWRNE